MVKHNEVTQEVSFGSHMGHQFVSTLSGWLTFRWRYATEETKKTYQEAEDWSTVGHAFHFLQPEPGKVYININ